MPQVHRLIARTAKEFAGEFYEHAAHDNQFFHHYPLLPLFVDREWWRFVRKAREVLTHMLTLPSTSDHVKAEIYEALQLDKAINAPATEVAKAIKSGTLH